MHFTQDTRSRPMLWLVCAACVSILCFWVPQLFHFREHESEFMRHVAAIRVLAFPVAFLASIVALCFYVILWRITRSHQDKVSKRFLVAGSALFLVAFAPALLFVFFIVAVLFT
jgi:glucan phosphoethanolaminetransferase (alkaline phosphatase superfamily)